MQSENSIEIDAPAGVVWDTFVDVEHWPDWTASVKRVRPLDGPSIEVGNRFEIEQPRLPRLVWRVTEVVTGSSWAWQVRSVGSTTTASHEVVASGPDRTVVRQVIDRRGPLGILAGVLTRRLTRRYLDLEAHGLRARAEQLRRLDASAG
jgi:uncharacterized membrane protein